MRSIKSKVVAAQFFGALVVSTLLGFASYGVMARLFLDTTRGNLLSIVGEEAMEVSLRIADHRQFFREVAEEELMEFSGPAFNAVGLAFHFTHFTSNYSVISVAGFDGREIVKVVDGEKSNDFDNLGGRPFFKEAVEGPGSSVTTEIGLDASDRPVIRFAFVMIDAKGIRHGVIVGSMPLERVTMPLLGFTLGQKGQTLLVDYDGTILHHLDKAQISRKIEGTGKDGLFQAIREGGRGFVRTDVAGGDSYAAYASVPAQELAVLTILPSRLVLAGPRKLRNSVFLISLAVTLLGGLLGFKLTRDVTKPITEPTSSAASLAAGDFSQRVHVTTDDEVGRLAVSFNRMCEKLDESYQELERQNEELKKMDLMKDALITDITHELKTPVAKQAMHVEILKRHFEKPEPSGDISGIFGSMEGNIRRQQNTIRNLLLVSRLESGGRAARREEVKIGRVLKALAEEYHGAFENLGIRLTCDIEEATVTSDSEMISLVVANLLDNAVKFRSSDDPRITIVSTPKERGVEISVSDNGTGMTNEEQDRVFDRFYQVTASSEGIGIGLSLSKMIVEKLGGTIEVTSRGRDRGTTAVVTLPKQA